MGDDGHLQTDRAVNERCTEFIYNQISPETRKKLTPIQTTGITLASGVTAGAAAAILSHVC